MHPDNELELPTNQTPKKWWIYQDTMVDLESLHDVLERAFAAAGIDQRFVDGAHGSHEAGLQAASTLPPPQPRHGDEELPLRAAVLLTSGAQQMGKRQGLAEESSNDRSSSTSVGTQGQQAGPLNIADKAADGSTMSDADPADAGKAEGAAASGIAENAVQEPPEDDEPDEDEIEDLIEAAVE